MQRRATFWGALSVTVLAGLIAFPVPGGADDRTPRRTERGAHAKKKEKGPAWSPRDAAFLQLSARQAVAHMLTASEAIKQGAEANVRKFAMRINKEQGALHTELQSVAKKRGVTLPTEIDAMHKKELKRMAKLEGAAFDRAYLEHMMKCTRYDMSRYRTQIKKGQDPQLKRWSAAKLPTLLDEVRTAAQLHQKELPKPAMR